MDDGGMLSPVILECFDTVSQVTERAICTVKSTFTTVQYLKVFFWRPLPWRNSRRITQI